MVSRASDPEGGPRGKQERKGEVVDRKIKLFSTLSFLSGSEVLVPEYC